MQGIIIEYFPLTVWLTLTFGLTRKIVGDTYKTILLFLLGGTYWSCSRGFLHLDDFYPENIYPKFQQVMNWTPSDGSNESLMFFLHFNCALMFLTILFTCAIPYCLSSKK